ncbi:LysR substrate-binding domain-containing protein [Micromonospora sp. NPDC050276]|uniref:LysR substrate-binding domain-containing protein n=1 Tax=Micromonospora sp. NPDC050276 TaxID=3364278 RepID=UPI0037AEA5A1
MLSSTTLVRSARDRAQTDQAFSAADLTRDVAFEVTAADLMASVVAAGLGVAMLPSAYVPRLTGVTTIEVADGPTRVEHLVWSRLGRTPAVNAFLAVLKIPTGPPPEQQRPVP